LSLRKQWFEFRIDQSVSTTPIFLSPRSDPDTFQPRLSTVLPKRIGRFFKVLEEVSGAFIE
jgi:hypothetical protein